MIRFEDATIELDQGFRLAQLTFSLNAGNCLAILGANGCGKSALVAALAGEGQLVSGDVEVAKRPMRIASVSLEEQAALIEREKREDDSDLTDRVNHGTPVQQILDEVCENRELQVQLIDALGINDILPRGFRALSTGETRKILLLRALTCKPDVLILDEPYEGLDASVVPKVRAILEALVGQQTMVFALNRLEEIPDGVSHVIRLENGRITQQFEPANSLDARRILGQIGSIRSDNLRLPPPLDPPDLALNADGSLVALNNGRIAYSDNIVFDELDWSIRPGEHWQVKGANGSGKTCLLSLITGDHPQCYVNDLTIFGMQRGSGESIWQVKRHLGYVSTSLHWDYRLSVSVANVILSGFFDSIGVYQKGSDKQQILVAEWLALLGLNDRRSEPFSKLSYGEQRLVLIARAMVKHPALLLLDEPCLGLDDANRQLVLALIRTICDEGRTTLVYVTHHEEDEIEDIRHSLILD